MAQLSGSTALQGPDVDLTAEGTSDWCHWTALSSSSGFQHKSTGGSQITDPSFDGFNGNLGAGTPLFSWSDGTPTASGSNHAVSYHSNGSNSFTVPADTTTRVLRVYWGRDAGTASLTAHLSDSSASDYTYTETANTDLILITTLTYSAGSAAQTLTITLASTGSGLVFMSSATLQVSAGLTAPPIDQGGVKGSRSARIFAFGGEPLSASRLAPWASDVVSPAPPTAVQARKRAPYVSGEPLARSYLAPWDSDAQAPGARPSRPIIPTGGEPVPNAAVLSLGPWSADSFGPVPKIASRPTGSGGDAPPLLGTVALAAAPENQAGGRSQARRNDAGSAHALPAPPSLGAWVHVADLPTIRRAARIHDSAGVPVQLLPIAKWAPPDQQLRPKKCPAPYFELFVIVPAALAPIPKLHPPLVAIVDDVILAVSVDVVELDVAVDEVTLGVWSDT